MRMITSVKFSFSRDWFAEWRECYRPITKRSTVLQKPTKPGLLRQSLVEIIFRTGNFLYPHLAPQGDRSKVNILFNTFHCLATFSFSCSCSLGKSLMCSLCKSWSCLNGNVICSSNFSQLSSCVLSLFLKLSVRPVRQSIQKRPEARDDSELKESEKNTEISVHEEKNREHSQCGKESWPLR